MASRKKLKITIVAATVLTLVVVFAIVGWVVSLMGDATSVRKLDAVDVKIPPASPAPVELIDVHAPGRTANELREWSQPIAADTQIPGQALRAYANAELIARDAWPECNLKWNTLAGIGWVETRHGTYSGNWFQPSEINSQGEVVPHIIGIKLDGNSGTADTPDTDNGEFDGDAEHDRAVGPMQFIPESWNRYGLDANGDGYANPHYIDDAALSSAKLLCDYGRNLDNKRDWRQAIFAYNQSGEYLRNVAHAANSYAQLQPAVR